MPDPSAPLGMTMGEGLTPLIFLLAFYAITAKEIHMTLTSSFKNGGETSPLLNKGGEVIAAARGPGGEDDLTAPRLGL
jgi:hypothetical protein